MGGVCAARRIAFALGIALTLVCVAPAARAIEFFEGRFQVHGFFEEQLRTIAQDFRASDDWDLTQWYHVLSLEIEADILPDGAGPITGMSAFSRVEVRYDCVWTRACGMFRQANAFGDRAHRLPGRLGDARRAGVSGAAFTGDSRQRLGVPRDRLGYQFRNDPDGPKDVGAVFNIGTLDGLFGEDGPDQIIGNADDPAPYVFERFLDYTFAMQATPGVENSIGTRYMPWGPGNKIKPIGSLRDRWNPFTIGDLHPTTCYPDGAGCGSPPLGGVAATPAQIALRGTPLQGGILNVNTGAFTSLPYRPGAENNFGLAGDLGVSRGLYYPSPELRNLIAKDALDQFDQNFSSHQLQWNHGASQQNTKELKELYIDVEAIDGRLWMRLGKQNIVWGKTELFRTTDQFNPQDLALASLPSLEESRIGLWAARAVWSFYNVGPLDDVRLELAANIDEVQPTDLGRCGEPYTPDPVCDKTFGLLAHGWTGLGVAGESRSEDPWDGWKGYEVGGRLEFRWDRFSFAITDFYGYNDIPFADKFYTYERNVDPIVGRPREANARGACITGAEPACLTPAEAVSKNPVNQQYFALICSLTVAFVSNIDPVSCGQTVFNSRAVVSGAVITEALSGFLGGQSVFRAVVAGLTATDPFILSIKGGGLALSEIPQVTLETALSGVPLGTNFGPGGTPSHPYGAVPDVSIPNGLGNTLSIQQQALLGCGPFYGTSCDEQGMDLLNAEGSALLQSFAGFDGTPLTGFTVLSGPQPGTVTWPDTPVCTRFEGGKTYILPGCRGPTYQNSDSPYVPSVDGGTAVGFNPALGNLGFDTNGDLNGDRPFILVGHPGTGAAWRSEMAAMSWNFMVLAAALSNNYGRDGCSFVAPQTCSAVRALLAIAGNQRNDIRAGGNGQFGRRDLVWAGGSEVLLRYEKRNVLGFSMDFAEDVTKSNWSVEATWIEGLPFSDQDQVRGYGKADTYNLTISVDRPTFINFLNQNRTFFFNSQWFFQWTKGYRDSFTAPGPYNVLATFTVQTGYFQDRLLPAITFVYDFETQSGAILPQMQYRFTENFSATFGVASFMGAWDIKKYSITPNSLPNVSHSGYRSYVENGLTAVRDRDEVFFRLRYTF